MDLGHPDVSLLKIYINDHFIKTILWPEFCTDITDYVIEGLNKITVELFSSNRNLLGPHHHKRGEVYAVCPSTFTSEKGWGWEDEDNQWADRYCFTKFGL